MRNLSSILLGVQFLELIALMSIAGPTDITYCQYWCGEDRDAAIHGV